MEAWLAIDPAAARVWQLLLQLDAHNTNKLNASSSVYFDNIDGDGSIINIWC